MSNSIDEIVSGTLKRVHINCTCHAQLKHAIEQGVLVVPLSEEKIKKLIDRGINARIYFTNREIAQSIHQAQLEKKGIK